MKRTVICLVGPMVSGKGDVGNYLKSLGFTYDSLSDRVREEADLRGIPRLRENLQDLGNELRRTYGLSVLAERTVEILKNVAKNVVIDGVRNPGEIDYLRNELGATVIGIDAPIEKRLEWYLERAKKRGEDGLTEEDFYRADNRDHGIGEDGSGQQVGLCLELADYRIYNDGSKEELFENIEHLLSITGFGVEGTRSSKEQK